MRVLFLFSIVLPVFSLPGLCKFLPPQEVDIDKVGEISLVFSHFSLSDLPDGESEKMEKMAEKSTRTYQVKVVKNRAVCDGNKIDLERRGSITSGNLKLSWSEKLTDEKTLKLVSKKLRLGKCSRAKPEVESMGRSFFQPTLFRDKKLDSWNAFMLHDGKIIGYSYGNLPRESSSYVSMIELAEEYKGYALRRLGEIKPGLCQILAKFSYDMLKNELGVRKITLSNRAGIAGCLCYTAAATEAGFLTYVDHEKRVLTDPRSTCLTDTPIEMVMKASS